jgi:hypothetical protein
MECMEPVAVKPSDDGKETIVKVRVSTAGLERLLTAFADGRLKSLGVVDVFVESPVAEKTPKKDWTKIDRSDFVDATRVRPPNKGR